MHKFLPSTAGYGICFFPSKKFHLALHPSTLNFYQKVDGIHWRRWQVPFWEVFGKWEPTGHGCVPFGWVGLLGSMVLYRINLISRWWVSQICLMFTPYLGKMNPFWLLLWITRWWVSEIFLKFHSIFGEDEPILTFAYFSDGLVKNHQPDSFAYLYMG